MCDRKTQYGLMLVWESQGFDLEEVRLPQKMIDIDAQSVGCQLGTQTSAQPPKSMGMILLDVELL